MNSERIRKLTYAALFLGVAMVLPFITGQIPEIGAMLSPMHIPVLLCGFMCGWPWGMAVGFIAPLLRSVTFGMPKLFPSAVAMAFELTVYGGMTGIMYRLLPHRKWTIYASLLIAMIAGRIVWGTAQVVLAGLAHFEFTWAIFITKAVVEAIPGIIMHIVLIPIIVMAMERAGLSLNEPISRKEKKV